MVLALRPGCQCRENVAADLQQERCLSRRSIVRDRRTWFANRKKYHLWHVRVIRHALKEKRKPFQSGVAKV